MLQKIKLVDATLVWVKLCRKKFLESRNPNLGTVLRSLRVEFSASMHQSCPVPNETGTG